MRDGVPLGEIHTVFGLAAMVGVSITFFVRNPQYTDHKIYYNSVEWRSTRQEKFNLIEEVKSYSGLEWKELNPDRKQNWLTEGLRTEFEDFMPIGSKEAKKSKKHNTKTIFKTYALGVSTNRDTWLYQDSASRLPDQVNLFIETYNIELDRWKRRGTPENLLDFLIGDQTKIKWSSLLLDKFKREIYATPFDRERIKESLYRPFKKRSLYFDRSLIDAPTLQAYFFPNKKSQIENQAMAITCHSQLPFLVQIVSCIPCMDVGGRPTQCFPFYTYDKDGSNRRENITDWALEQFRQKYANQSSIENPKSKIEKWDIFYYVYGLLHHPTYRETYAANLRRELPRIPFVKDFWGFAEAGARLAEIHVNYEQQPEYPLKFIENPDEPLNWRVEKMRLSKDKTQLKYNDFLTLSGIPPETFEYKLGNRSALHWVIDQYRVKTDKRSEIVNDPNNLADEQYIVRLIGQVITVSLETVKIVKNLPELNLE